MIDSSRSNPIPWSSQLFEWMLLLTQEVSTNWCSWKCPQTNSQVPWFCFDHWFFKKCFQTAFWKKNNPAASSFWSFLHINEQLPIRKTGLFISSVCPSLSLLNAEWSAGMKRSEKIEKLWQDGFKLTEHSKYTIFVAFDGGNYVVVFCCARTDMKHTVHTQLTPV